MKTIMINSNLNTIEPEKNELEDIASEIMQRHLFLELRKCGWREMPWKRYVVLSFDIVSCKNLNPKLSAKLLEGLPSFVVLFGIQIINTKRFQPIGKVFCRLSTPPALVARCVKSFIRDLMRCEYFVVASVCRTMSYLRQVVKHLVGVDSLSSETDAHVYNVEFLKVVHLYDPVTMLEHTFLSFLKHTFRYKLGGKDMFASYEDCKKIMIASTAKEVINDIFNHTSNIVCAIRLFSMTFYREIQDCISKGKLYDTGTAEFCAMMDKIFDTVHGDIEEFSLKLNRSTLTGTSTHFIIWEEYLETLSTIKACSNYKGKICKNLTRESYDSLNSVNRMEISMDTAALQANLQKRVDELQKEYAKIGTAKIDEEDLGNIKIKHCDNRVTHNEEVNNRSTAANNDFNNDNEFQVEIEKLNDDAGQNLPNYYTFNNTVDNFGDYSKKLFLILKESECTDVKKFDDYESHKFDENGESTGLYLNPNRLEYINEYKILHMQQTLGFVIIHFGKYLDYIKYFIDDLDVYKKTNYLEMIMENYEETFEIYADCISESEIIIGPDYTDIDGNLLNLSDCNKTECTESENYLIPSTEAPTVNSCNEKQEIVELDCLLSDDFYLRSPANSIVVNSTLVTYDNIHESLKSYSTCEEAVNKIIVHLQRFDVFDLNSIAHERKLSDQVYIIQECLLKMFNLLSSNNANVSERKNAYKKLMSIKEQLKKLIDDYKETQESKDNDTIHAIPQFFTKITLSDEGSNNNNTHIDLNKLHRDMGTVYPEVGQLYKEVENVTKEKTNSASKPFEKEEMRCSVAENEFRPFVFDAWKISINGAKRLFEFLEKKRFRSLDMSSLNIDHLRQILNVIKIDNGIHIENNYQIELLFINPSIVCEVFETDGALILE